MKEANKQDLTGTYLLSLSFNLNIQLIYIFNIFFAFEIFFSNVGNVI